MPRKLWAVAWLEILGGLRRYAILGLLLLAFGLEVCGLIFMEFIPRDIGRATADFVLTIGWFAGLLFLFFHCVQVFAWGEERRTIQTLLARPVRRWEYVLGVYLGLGILLLLLNLTLALTGYCILHWMHHSPLRVYFQVFNVPYYILAWLGLYCIELMILAVIALFSGLVRGGFPVLLLSLSYYLICTGLPVVRQAFSNRELQQVFPMEMLLKWMTAFFPDLGRFDFKTIITEQYGTALTKLGLDFGLFFCFLVVVLGLACVIYQKRDIK